MKIDEFRALRVNDPKSVVHLIGDCLRGAPEDYLYLIEAGHACFSMGDQERGLVFFKRSFQLCSNSYAAYCYAKAPATSGRAQDGAAIATDYLRRFGFQEDCFNILVECDDEMAVEIAEELDAVVDLSMRVATALAVAYARRGRWEKATTLVQRATVTEQHFSRLLFTVLLRTGKIRVRDREACSTPMPVMQYWDPISPPNDVNKLLEHAKSVPNGGYRLLNANDFQVLVKRYYGLSAGRIIKLCEHPAAQADVARILFLYEEGGVYLDADMMVRSSGAFCFEFGRAFLTVADSLVFPVITNWFLGARAGDSFLLDCIDSLGSSITKEAFDRMTIFDVTGPGLMTKVFIKRLVADNMSLCLYSEGCLLDVFCYGGNLDYKADPSKNWAKELNKGERIYVPGDLL